MAETLGKLMDFNIWNENQSRNKIWKSSLSAHVDFFPNLDKNTGLSIWNQFGTDLVIKLFGNLEVWVKNKYCWYPLFYHQIFNLLCNCILSSNQVSGEEYEELTCTI